MRRVTNSPPELPLGLLGILVKSRTPLTWTYSGGFDQVDTLEGAVGDGAGAMAGLWCNKQRYHARCHQRHQGTLNTKWSI